MTISDIVLEFATDLKTILGQNLSKIILYGSYARMDYDASSDVDLMVLVTLSDEEIKKVENQVFDCAFELEMKYGVDISPIIKMKCIMSIGLIHYPFIVISRRRG